MVRGAMEGGNGLGGGFWIWVSQAQYTRASLAIGFTIDDTERRWLAMMRSHEVNKRVDGQGVVFAMVKVER